MSGSDDPIVQALFDVGLAVVATCAVVALCTVTWAVEAFLFRRSKRRD